MIAPQRPIEISYGSNNAIPGLGFPGFPPDQRYAEESFSLQRLTVR